MTLFDIDYLTKKVNELDIIQNKDNFWDDQKEALKVINEWESIKEASQVLGINKNVIVRCCQRKGIVAGGFHWCKIENWTPDWLPKEKKPLIGRKKSFISDRQKQFANSCKI